MPCRLLDTAVCVDVMHSQPDAWMCCDVCAQLMVIITKKMAKFAENLEYVEPD